MTEQPSESIINRIKALLSMAEHPNSNENEAAIAMEKAQAMLLEYNLTIASIKTEEIIDEAVQKFDVHSEHGFVWKSRLLNIIAKSNLCYVIVTPNLKMAYLFGKKTNVNITMDMFVWVKEQLESISLRKFTAYKTSGGKEHGKTWKTSFFYGATNVINSRLQKPIEEFSNGSGYSIVLANDNAIQTVVHSVFPSIRQGVNRKINLSNSGYSAGKEAGVNIKFARTGTLPGGSRLALGSGT